MELMKTQIQVLEREQETMAQFAIEEECNVPDTKPDVGRLIQYNGNVKIGDVKVQEERVHISGMLKFRALYAIDRADGKLECLAGEIPIHEVMNLKGISQGDKICLRWEIEDLDLQIIHSRKMNVRSLVTFRAVLENQKNLVLAVDLRDEHVNMKKEEMKVLGLHVHNRDTIRIQEEFTLTSNKPNIQEILWDSVDVRGVDVRAEEDRVVVKGEIFAFVLYIDENDADTLEWLEYSIPFQKELECADCKTNMIPDLEMLILHSKLTVKPDSDGEERIVLTDVVLEADLKVYYEEQVSVLMDVYHPAKEYETVCESAQVDQLMVKNYAKCRLQERVSIGTGDGRILQICHCDGTVHIEESRAVENGILVEGYISVRILYITGEDDMPFYSTETKAPFSMVVEVPEMSDVCRWYLHTDLEQLATTMVDGSEVEVKALINLNALVLRQMQLKRITNIEVHELNLEKMNSLPGIVGYVVQKGDSLWDIAKKYYTSIELIQELNDLSDEEIKPNDKLILVKNVDC